MLKLLCNAPTTAYLLADLVPTTVFALGAVTFIIKRRDKAALEALEIIDVDEKI